MPHAYTEELLVELPAFDVFGALGWQLASSEPLPEALPSGSTVWVDETGLFGREVSGEVILTTRLRPALERLNPRLPPEAVGAAIDDAIRAKINPGPPDISSVMSEISKLLDASIEGVTMTFNWRQTTQARARLRLAIEDLLDTDLPRVYSPELYRQKCSAVFEHFYESYPEKDAGI